MPQNTIGQFIAALRKANGMTQQEVADRLNVSNKAVSRWERDECSPDLSAIPVLAELFGVTCDELLKGERIHTTHTQEVTEKKEPKVEKQVKHLIRKVLSSFKTMSYIALALALVGLICMFGISYGFYRPVIGFAIMLLFEITAAAVELIALTKAKDTCKENELFELADTTQVADFYKQLGSLSFYTFFPIIATILLSLPLISIPSEYTNSVLTFEAYITIFFGIIAALLVILFLKCKAPYCNRISGIAPQRHTEQPGMKAKRNLNLIHFGLLFLFTLFLWIQSYKATVTFSPLGILLPIGMILVLCIFLSKHKDCRKELILTGIRNILLIPASVLLVSMHSVAWYTLSDGTQSAIHDIWHYEFLWYSIIYAVLIFLLFCLIECSKKKTEKPEKNV